MFPWLHYVKSFCNLSLSWSRALLLALNTQQHVPGIIFQVSQNIKAPANSDENSERHRVRISLEHWELFHIHSGGRTLLFSPHYSLSWGSSMLSSARFIDMAMDTKHGHSFLAGMWVPADHSWAVWPRLSADSHSHFGLEIHVACFVCKELNLFQSFLLDYVEGFLEPIARSSFRILKF